ERGGDRRDGGSGRPAELRVPGVAEGVAEEIESEDGQADREAGEHGQPRRLLEEGAARRAQHEAPRRLGRLRTDAKEAQRRLDQDRVAETDRSDDVDGSRDVWQDVAEGGYENSGGPCLRRA